MNEDRGLLKMKQIFIVAIVAIMYYVECFQLTGLNDSRLDKYWNGVAATYFIKQIVFSIWI